MTDGTARAEAILDPADVTLRPFAAGDLDWLVARHIAHYSASDGFDESFGILVEEVLTEFLAKAGPDDRGWIAEAPGGARLGSIFCVRRSGAAAQLRLFYLDPAWRGIGLGRRMIETLIAHARGAGFRRVDLWTHASHRAAGRLYARTGFVCLSSEPTRSFGRDMVVQNWTLDLSPGED